MAALNVLALTNKQLGSLNCIRHVVGLGVYVAATQEFTEHPKVADAASELLRGVFGAETVSSRLVIGVASLPLGSPVELEVILEVKMLGLGNEQPGQNAGMGQHQCFSTVGNTGVGCLGDDE